MKNVVINVIDIVNVSVYIKTKTINDNDRHPTTLYTVNMERFAGPNIHGFSPMKFFTGILS